MQRKDLEKCFKNNSCFSIKRDLSARQQINICKVIAPEIVENDIIAFYDNGLLGKKSNLIIKEKILTTEEQIAKTHFNVTLSGEDSSCEVISRSVAKGESYQEFISKMIGDNKSFGHVECDAILMDSAHIVSTPEIVANNIDATLVHEAAIGKIAGEQLIKLMTLGLDRQEAEDMIIKGFLS